MGLFGFGRGSSGPGGPEYDKGKPGARSSPPVFGPIDKSQRGQFRSDAESLARQDMNERDNGQSRGVDRSKDTRDGGRNAGGQR
jgi:hypothetical protein